FVGLTEQCNLRCPHCFQRVRPRSAAFQESKIIASIESIVDGAAATIIFYGGEPSLFPRRMVRIMESLAHRSRLAFGIQTNGSLLERVTPLAHLLKFVSISINATTVANLNLRVLTDLATRTTTIGRFIYDGSDLFPLIETTARYFNYVYWQIVNRSAPSFSTLHYRAQILALIQLMFKGAGTPLLIPLEYVNYAIRRPSTTCMPLCGLGTTLAYIDSSGSVFPCDELAYATAKADAATIVSNTFPFCAKCHLLNICRGRCPAVLAKHGPQAYQSYCALSRVLVECVRDFCTLDSREPDEFYFLTEMMP